MSIILTVLQIVAPVFILAGIGFVWVKLGEEYRVKFVTRLSMTMGIPALVFTSLMKTRIDPAALTDMVYASLLAYGGMTVVVFVVVKLFRLDMRTYLAPLLFGNTGNLGLPLALFAFGEVGLSYAVVIFAIMAIYSFTFGVWMVSGGGSPLKVLKEPLVGATLLGALFLYNGWQTPDWVTNTLDLIGQMAIPLMLITLGVAVARLKPVGFGRALLLSIFKVIAAVGVSAGAAYWLDLSPVPFAVLVLQVSTPVAVTSYLLAEKYEADAESVAGLVVVSTVVSLVSLPVILAFLL
ncbi:MAG: AEC family transporter [Paracoccaceae bacterium]|nr:AEC family transporter [Paracoccaceae bacterium]